jgi:homoserine O-succinyltransferase/O-acetyltransferase
MRPRGTYQNDNAEIVIGLVNNMPPAAVRTTDWQFQSLLDLASQRRGVRVKLHLLAGCLPRTTERPGAYLHHESLDILRDNRIDGMIVTGCEPQAAAITDEPIWPALARLVDWADEYTISTIWSCLAAHAAVYRVDGVSRQRLPEKLSGIFECAKASDHHLVPDEPERWRVPHSRYNGLDEETLRREGYQILSRAPRVGPDMAVKQSKSLFVHLQGHPEYGPDTLLREYRRDIKRFLNGKRECCPEIPEQYFDRDTQASLAELREQASRRPDPELLSAFEAAMTPPVPTWGDAAVTFYTQWLSYLAEQKFAWQSHLHVVNS